MAGEHRGMATGYAAQLSADVAKDHGTLYKPNVQLLAFISTSAGWIYPIDRFFGRALYGKRSSIMHAYADEVRMLYADNNAVFMHACILFSQAYI